jgi:hypothetical protein
MGTVESYRAAVADWATQVEFVVHEPGGQLATLGELSVPSQPQSSFLIAVASAPNDRIPPFLDCLIELTTPQGQSWQPSPNVLEEFRAGDKRLIVINRPAMGDWKVSAHEGIIPYAVTVLVFHPFGVANAPPGAPALAPPKAAPFKCRACKTTAKGLALAIVAAVSYAAALPGALIGAVSSFMGGVSSAVAAAFIASVIGDTADMIAKKLCQGVGLCP